MNGERAGSHEYLALDLETTGLDPHVDEIISMAAIPIVGGRIDLTRLAYVEAEHDRPPRSSGVAVHGLRPVDLARGKGRETLRDELARSLHGRQLVAWAAWVEASFLAALFGGSERKWRSGIIDVIDLVATLDRAVGAEGAGEESLVACCARFGVPHSLAHHALGDALMTAQLFVVVTRRLATIGLTGQVVAKTTRRRRRPGSGAPNRH
jgi:DNA polymerase-3 subunit epsilon